MSHLGGFVEAEVRFPETGAWRLHHQPLTVFERPPRDRFDDPRGEYRVRYFASTIRGVMLEVLNHFRPNDEAEAAFKQVQTEGIDILAEEPPGSVPEKWLSIQHLAMGAVPEIAMFVDVDHPAAQVELDQRPTVRAALTTPEAIAALGPDARLDGSTIKLAGPLGRSITQAVGREIFEGCSSESRDYVGIRYSTRFDRSEPCWAVFDEHVVMDFPHISLLNPLNPSHLEAINNVARLYRLHLPFNWTQ